MSAIVKQSLQKQCKNYRRIHGQTEGEAAVTPLSMNTPMIHLALSYQSTLLKLTHNSLFFCTIFKNFAWWWLMTLDSLRRRRWFPITVPPILSHARGGGLCPVLQQDDTLQCVRRLPKLKDAVHHVPLTLSCSCVWMALTKCYERWKLLTLTSLTQFFRKEVKGVH